MQNNKKNINNILPSKKFTILIVICLVVIGLIVLISNILQSRAQFEADKNKVTISDSATLEELANQDSNSNGIPDWEESLYGLDPKGDGIANKKIITQRKIDAQSETGYITPAPDATVTVTDQFSRTLLTSILALNQSGNLTPEAVGNLSNSMIQSLNSKRDATSTYQLSDLNVTESTSTSVTKTYLKNYNAVFKKGTDAGMGTDIGLVNQVLNKTEDGTTYKKIDDLANIYETFAKDIIAIKTPNDISTKALSLANSAMLISYGLKKIELTKTDAMNAMIGFDEYGASVSVFNKALIDINSYFYNNL